MWDIQGGQEGWEFMIRLPSLRHIYEDTNLKIKGSCKGAKTIDKLVFDHFLKLEFKLMGYQKHLTVN